MSTPDLPPLPIHVGEESHGPSQSPVNLYDADQMRAYAAAAVLAEREARIADLEAEVERARWYCVSREGMATLCTDEEDAQANAAHCDRAWPAGGPHRAVQLVASPQPAEPAPSSPTEKP